jgi:hypothetical protein
MSDNNENVEVARLERLNRELNRSLRRCREMLHDYEIRLTANQNDAASRSDKQRRKKPR